MSPLTVTEADENAFVTIALQNRVHIDEIVQLPNQAFSMSVSRSPETDDLDPAEARRRTEAVKERILSAAFQTAAPRTAGFNTTDLSQMSGAGTAMMIMLMLIGGASGSTAGGMKINTFAVLLITAWSVFRQRKDPSAFDRRIDHESAAKASTIFILYILLFVTAAMVISRIESLPLRDCLFETASAVATVGLTLGITPGLGMVSRGILVVLMFLGRVGGLTLIFAALSDNKGRYGRLPEENISIG